MPPEATLVFMLSRPQQVAGLHLTLKGWRNVIPKKDRRGTLEQHQGLLHLSKVKQTHKKR